MPIKLYDSKQRKTYVAQTSITGKKGLPLHVTLHGSQSGGGTTNGLTFFSSPVITCQRCFCRSSPRNSASWPFVKVV